MLEVPSRRHVEGVLEVLCGMLIVQEGTEPGRGAAEGPSEKDADFVSLVREVIDSARTRAKPKADDPSDVGLSPGARAKTFVLTEDPHQNLRGIGLGRQPEAALPGEHRRAEEPEK
jgi:hypothetical protein